ncbi:hypothetical protein ROZALSC1DRAFT_16731, partial [Rozella allomycis CSF55]
DEHMLSIKEVADRFQTSVDEESVTRSRGLTEDKAKELLVQYGRNTLTPPKKDSLLKRFLHFLTGLFNVLLMVAGILSVVLYFLVGGQENIILGIVLIVVTLLNAFIEFFQEYKSQSILESFLNMIPSNSTVIREGKMVEVASETLVPGDVVIVKIGDKVPADIRLISCNEIKVDNSSLTGESEPQERSLLKGNNNYLEASNLMFFGTLVVNGEGYGVVIRTGDATVLGSIASMTCKEEKRPSQMSREIDLFVKKMAGVSITLAIIFFIIGMATNPKAISTNFAFAIGILVAFVPQGLPATVTLLLTIAAKKMSKMNVLVKDLQGVETLGGITLLASDKTGNLNHFEKKGTLTQNKMSVVGCYLNLSVHQVNELEYHEEDGKSVQLNVPNLKELTEISCLCSKARFDESDSSPIEKRRIIGDATETGLMRYAVSHVKVEELQSQHPKVFEIPFNSSNKWHMTVHKRKHDKGELTVYLKGAPERIIKKCKYIKINDKIEEWNNEHTQQFNVAYETFASQGQRVLAFAECLIDNEVNFKFVNEPPNYPIDNFTFIGLIALMDPPKKGVRKAVTSCRNAGIQVVMVTGDHPLTAEAIARKIGLLSGISVLRR